MEELTNTFELSSRNSRKLFLFPLYFADTAKLDAAREKGVVIVSYEWLIDCVDEGEVLDTEDFEIP